MTSKDPEAQPEARAPTYSPVPITPQLAFFVFVAGVILILLRRVTGRGRRKRNTPDAEG